MILDLNKLTHDQNTLFDKIFNDSKSEYVALIEDIYEKSDKSIYFLLSSVTSRDIYLNDSLIKLTQLSLIKHFLVRDKVKTVIVYDNNQHKIIKSYIRKNKLDARLYLVFPYKDHVLNILKLPYICLKNISTIINFIRSKSQSRLSKIKELKGIVLVNTFFIPSMFVGNVYQDRYYPKLIDFANNKDKIFFNPSCLLGNKLSDSIKICEKINNNFIFNFDYLKKIDYFRAFFASFTLVQYYFKNIYFSDFNVSSIINTEVKKNIIRQSVFKPLLNYFFLMRLKEAQVDVKLFIDWFENQQLNRGFNMSKSTHYPDVKSVGYQGWILSNNIYYFHQPTKFEKDIGSIPNEIAVIGRGLVKNINFDANVKTVVSPAFRYDYIHHQPVNISKRKKILISLPVSSDMAKYILDFCASNLHKNYQSYVVVNCHPGLKLNTLNDKNIFKYSDKSFKQLIFNIGLVISNTSSTCVEALALGVPVIILNGGSSINQNPIPITISKNIWDECDNQIDFNTAFTRLYLNKNIQEHSNTAKLVRKEFFEPVTTKSVNNFLGFKI